MEEAIAIDTAAGTACSTLVVGAGTGATQALVAAVVMRQCHPPPLVHPGMISQWSIHSCVLPSCVDWRAWCALSSALPLCKGYKCVGCVDIPPAHMGMYLGCFKSAAGIK